MWLSRLNELKKKSGKNTDEISKLSNVPLGTLNKLFAGQTKNPKLSTIKAVVYALGYTLDDLDDQISPRTNIIPISELPIINLCKQLNDEGQQKLVTYANDLISTGKYTKSNKAIS